MWDCLEHLEKPTIEDKIQSLKTDNIHGRCVWDCEHTVVDHQSVAINFADGATATLNMIGGTAKAERNLHIIGTKGEIKGVFDDSVFTVRTIDTASESGWREEVVDLAIGGDKSGMTGSHGGGDLRLVEDFVRVLQGEQPSISCTNINDSLNGHLAVFQAEKGTQNGNRMHDAAGIKTPHPAGSYKKLPHGGRICGPLRSFLLLRNKNVSQWPRVRTARVAERIACGCFLSDIAPERRRTAKAMRLRTQGVIHPPVCISKEKARGTRRIPARVFPACFAAVPKTPARL